MLTLLKSKRLKAGLLGDMPTIYEASTANVYIVGIVKQSSTAIVAKGDLHVRLIAGKRIGDIDALSAHYLLLQGLASAGIAASQVKLIPLDIRDMPDALARGGIDEFSAWEAAPTILLEVNDHNHIVFRGVSTDYFVIKENFVKISPYTALELVAAFVRMFDWMRHSRRNTEKAFVWTRKDAALFSEKANQLSVEQIVAITHRDILDIPSVPVILSDTRDATLQKKIQFLKTLGKLQARAKWENIKKALRYDGLTKVLANAKFFQMHNYHYEK